MAVLSPWRVLASRCIHADRWIRLRADRCVTDEGAEIAPYYVLEYPDWVHIVPVGPDGRILLVEQYRHGAGQITLELPAGRVDAEDASPEQAAARELREETGAVAAELTWIHSSSPNPASHANRVHTVLAEGVVATGAPTDDPSERLQARWVSADEAFSLACDGVLPLMQAGSVSAAYRRLGWIDFCRSSPSK